MRVRSAIAADSEALSRISKNTFALACPKDTPAEELELYIRDNLTESCFRVAIANQSQKVRVLEEGSDVVGFTLVDHQPDLLGIPLADSIPELKRCYVDVKHHGTGAAQLLLTATLEDISERIRLTVNDQNSRAIGFYQRNGFLIVGEANFQCGEDIHRDLVMVREH